MDSVFNRIGEWNPQLLRELKGRLKPAPLFLALGAAVLLQGLLILIAAESDYISQEFAWSVIFHSLGWVIPLTLWICGVFLLTSDIAKEVSKGTLNFIRLSPQESEKILWGKVLGVPIIVYCFTLLCLPLHAFAALQEYSLVSVLALYSLWGLGCGVCYAFALLVGLIGNEAIALQVLIITAVWVFCAIARLSNPERTWAILSLILSANLMLIYGAIIQLSLLNRSKKRMAIAGSFVMAVLVLPLIIVATLELDPKTSASWWMFSIFGGSWFALEQTARTLILPFAFSLLAQWAIFAALSTTLMSRLNKAGQSTTKVLMTD